MNYFRCPQCGKMFHCTGHCGEKRDGCICKNCLMMEENHRKLTQWDIKCFTLSNYGEREFNLPDFLIE